MTNQRRIRPGVHREGSSVFRVLARALLLTFVVASLAPAAGPSPAGAQPAPESGSSDWRMVTTGGAHTCGIRTTGRLYCWGRDLDGQIGNGGPVPGADEPIPVEVGGAIWASVDAGIAHTCGRTTAGRVYCWGSDEYGALGDGGTNTDHNSPVEVAGGFTTWTSVSVGGSHACGRRTNGRLYCWGYDGSGELGNNPTLDESSTPVLVAGGATNWTAVTAGGAHTCGRRATGRVYCWGNDADGQVGDGGADIDRPTPALVAGGGTDWATVTAGGFHTCGLRVSGLVYCWGEDDQGQVGDSSDLIDRAAPVRISGRYWASVSAGADHTCGQRRSGPLYCWGADSDSQLGDGGTDTDFGVPKQIAGGATDWTGVSTGSYHTCARTTAGRLYCWGADGAGQLGDGGATADQSRPTEVFAP